ncbi:isoprenylcysteine carboxylmethyltransferase family protein [Compostibacter hankyongensis]|uniref:Protein-S-isoprenylcysteine O-methyltransferase n=1 Tax=Compostibacter hankyongensis TaxID=1007089 RepID=A0ABP8FEN3_9BACT
MPVREQFYEISLLLIVGIFLWLRMYFKKKYYVPGHQKVIARSLPQAQLLLQVLLGLSMVLPPLLLVFTDWLDFAGFYLSAAYRLAGWVVAVISLLLLWWTHRSLHSNWSPSVEIREEHDLITAGPFRYVRHPMYTAFFFFYASFLPLSANLFAGLLPVTLFFVILYLRVPVEEKMLQQQFGERYVVYKAATRRFIPFLF